MQSDCKENHDICTCNVHSAYRGANVLAATPVMPVKVFRKYNASIFAHGVTGNP